MEMMNFTLYSITIVCMLLIGINGSFLKITTVDGDPYTNLSLYNVSSHDRKWLSFDVIGGNKKLIGLFGERNDLKYEIIIGDGVIRIGSEYEQNVTAPIDPDKEMAFWIGWRNRIINVGYGYHFPVDEQLNITDSVLQMIHSIGVKSTGNNTEWSIRGEYIGCLEDITRSGILETLFNTKIPMTLEKCRRFCRNFKTKYAGTKNSTQCYCGDSFDVATPVLDDNMCNVICNGDATETCGGENATTLYLTEAFCAPGNYLTSYQRCLPCPLGFYQKERDKYSCDMCPPQMTTVQVRSIDVANCSFDYLGCYTPDYPESLEQMKTAEYTSNDTGQCIDFCSTFEMLYTITNVSTCICISSLDEWTRSARWTCESCSDNLHLAICTGHQYFSIYKTKTKFIHEQIRSMIARPVQINYSKQYFFKEAACGYAFIVLQEEKRLIYRIYINRSKVQYYFIIQDRHWKTLKQVILPAETNCDIYQTLWLEIGDLYISIGKGRQLGKDTIGTVNNMEMYKPDQINIYSNTEACWGFENDIHEAKQSTCDSLKTNPKIQMTTAITSTCMCNCSKVPVKLIYTDNELKHKTDTIANLLKVDTKTTKAYQRRKISARDMRPSAIGVGAICGVTIILIFLVTVLMMDAQHFTYFNLLLKKYFGDKKAQ